MITDPSHPSGSALRERMIEDMFVRGFTEDTRRDYIRCVKAFAAFIGRSPDTATAEDLRRFQLHQTQSGHAAAGHQQRGLGAALLLHRDARPARSCPPLSRSSTSRASCPGAERRGGGAAARSGTGASSTRPRSARPMAPGCGCPRSWRSRSTDIDSDAHADPRRAGQGRARIATPCCRRSCSNCCAPGGGRVGAAA